MYLSCDLNQFLTFILILMESKYGFVKMTIAEFSSWIQFQRIARTILTVQQRHTWSPNYTHFNGSNYFER